MKNIQKQAFDWVRLNSSEAFLSQNFSERSYCKTRDIFQARLEKLVSFLVKTETVGEERAYIAAAIAGEIGNNSFDHNLGNWRDIPGVFFAYEKNDRELMIALTDRGQGVLKTLKKVKLQLSSDKEALKVAFTQNVSGRAPERRGNGLKFVKENIKNQQMNLEFYSGKALASLNDRFELADSPEEIKGCLAIIKI
ncbi:hypothetical protein KJ912_00515, partial [Patescibacteria group bacterium]|nr:hypothetical protein [Patescibacteria group bacterium]